MAKRPTYQMKCEHSFEIDDWDLEDIPLIVEYTYFPGEKGVHTLPNGDPGYPDDYPEVELLSCKLAEDVTTEYEDEDGEVIEKTYPAGTDVSEFVDEDLITEMCFSDADFQAEAARDDAAAATWEARRDA